METEFSGESDAEFEANAADGVFVDATVAEPFTGFLEPRLDDWMSLFG